MSSAQGIKGVERRGLMFVLSSPSGAGKTTLLNLVARFYDPTAGAVRFDGVDLRDLRLRDVQSRIAIVTQDPFLFSTTIRENIRCGRPAATDGEIEDAARAAGHPDVIAPPTFAIAVTLEAAMVVLDDPDVGIDYSRVVHGEQRFTHHRPIRAGDRLVATTTIDAARSVAGNAVITRPSRCG